jgi:hypothetical protein
MTRADFVYNYVGELEQIVESTKPVPAGDCVLSASFEKSGKATPTEGMLSLYINKEKSARERSRPNPASSLSPGKSSTSE